MQLTHEQSAILDFACASPDNLMIQAYAGTGKTKALELIDEALPGPHLLICFNKSVAEEASKRVRSTTTVKNLNSLGHRIWASTITSKLVLVKDKTLQIYRSLTEATTKAEAKEIWDVYDQVTSGVALAKALGYIPPTHTKANKALCTWTQFAKALDEEPSDFVQNLITEILLRSIAQAYDGIIDFNDQLYMPALFGGIYPSFPLVMVDEYQDLSPVNHAMVARLCRRSRQIGVGDEAQSIYGFRGAKPDSMSDAVRLFKMAQLPLSISFRCPQSIVANVLWRVPTFQAHRPGGHVETLTSHLSAVEDDGVILCRNNAPLIHAALVLLSNGQSVNVAGTDISARLIKTMSKLGPETLDRRQIISAIDDWLATKQERGSKTAKDTADCMRLFAERGTNLTDAITYAKNLFSQDGTIKLMTGHKAKGLEFPHVYHLDSEIIGHGHQDKNIHYVIDTRSSDKLSYISTGEE